MSGLCTDIGGSTFAAMAFTVRSLSVLVALSAAAIAGAEGPTTWPADFEKGLSADDLALLTRAKDTLLGNSTEGKAWAPYRGIRPSRGKYNGVWNWDSAFHAAAVSHWDPDLARQQIKILFDHQLDNGALADVIYDSGKMNTAASKPPVMGWAVAVVDHRAPDDAFLKELYPKLIKLGEFWENERGGKKDGLFFYAGADVGWDSGWDTSPRWDNGYRQSKTDDKRFWAIDLNCYMVMHYRAVAYVAGRLGKTEDQKRFRAQADALAAKINEVLWDEQQGFYTDRERVTKAHGQAMAPAGFMPLFIHIAPADRAERVAKVAADPQKFFPGMPTVAYDEATYKSSDYWRGPNWLNTSFMALKGLKDYGDSTLAEAMRKTTLDWVKADQGNIWEYYDSRTGAGHGAKFFGWSCAFSILFITDWNNDNVTWLFPEAPKTTNEVLPPK